MQADRQGRASSAERCEGAYSSHSSDALGQLHYRN